MNGATVDAKRLASTTVTSTAAVSTKSRPHGGAGAARGRSKGSRLLVAVAVILSVLGAILATVTVIGARGRASAEIGERVGTSFGSFTVTRISTTFVPDTQGPPSAAQHAGTNGNSQFQVWVSLETTAGGKGVEFDTGQFSLVSETGSGQPLRAAGSSLDKGVLEPGSSIDGQVWFDPRPGSGGLRWLVFTPPDGNAIRVSLGQLGQFTTPSPGSSFPAGSPTPSQGH